MFRFFCDPTCSRVARAAKWNAVSESEESSETAEPVGGTDETVPTVPEQQAAEQSGQTLKFDQAMANELGMTWGSEPPKVEHEPDKAEPVPEDNSEPRPETEEAEPEPEEETTPAEGADSETKPPKELKISEQIKWYEERKLPVPWHLPRIAELTAKRHEANEEREKALARAQDAEAKLQSVTAPPPTESSPFADVFDLNQLNTLEQTYEKLLEFAEKHHNGAEGVVVGKNEDGSDKIEDLSAEQVAEMRYRSDRALRKDIPNRKIFLAQRDQLNARVETAYPELKEKDHEFAQAVAQLERRVPMLVSSFPDAKLWIARAVRGLQWELSSKRNGDKPAEIVKKIEASARTKIAPSVTKTRSSIERKGADLAAANKELEQTGSYEAAEKMLTAMFSKRQGAKKVQPVG